jgi:hypothetical protein
MDGIIPPSVFGGMLQECIVINLAQRRAAGCWRKAIRPPVAVA